MVVLSCAVGLLASTIEALCDSELPPGTREDRWRELCGQLGDAHRSLGLVGESVLPPAAACSDLGVLEGETVVQVRASRWGRRPRRQRREWGSALGGLEPPSDPDTG